MDHRVRILDSTLREGEQTPSVAFTMEEKLQIARKLDEVGVDMIEAGDPNVSQDVYQAVKRIANDGLKAEVLAHCRAIIEDVDTAISCDVPRVAIFLGTSDTHLTYKLRRRGEQAIEMACTAIEHARSSGLKVRFTAEDATRTDYRFLVRICQAAIEAGADRISLPDTVGVATPETIRDLFENLSKGLRAELDVHCHNDMGLALANTLAAVESGATVAHATVNGLGERAGITSLSELAVAMKIKYDIETLRLAELPALSLLVEKCSGLVIAPNAPIVGENAFSHKAGVHTAGVLSNPNTYEGFPPELVGRHREIIIDKYTGTHAIRARLDRLGISINDDQIMRVAQKIKERTEIGSFRDSDLIDLVEKSTGLDFSPQIPQYTEALVLVRCQSNVHTSSVARKIRVIRGVKRVCEISGDYDIELSFMANTTPELNDCLERIRSIDGVVTTNTRLVLKTFENQRTLGA
jgi:2-isopropylmalate synthase